MKIAFIVVLYKTPAGEYERLVSEIKEIGVDDYKIYAIDNTHNNKGYAWGVNQGIQKSLTDNCDLLIVLNPDVSLKGITKESLLAGVEQFDIWGGAMTQNDITYYGGVIDRLRATGGLIKDKPKERFVNADFISGSLMVVKKEVIKKNGLFDEGYFMYYEDVDFCLRARKQGLKCGIDTDLKYTHFETSATLPQKEKLLSQSRFKFFFKHSSFRQKIYESIRLPKTIIEYILKRKFLFSFLSLNASSLVIKVLNLILFIFLVKQLPIEDYGIYSLIWAQVTLLAPLVDLGTTSYGLFYMSDKRDEEFNTLFNFRLILSIIIFLVTVFLSFFIFKFNLKLIFYTFILTFIIFSNMLSGSYFILVTNRQKAYLSSFISSIFNIFLTGAIIIGLFINQNVGLIFVITSVLYNLYSIFYIYLLRKNIKKISFKWFDQRWVNIVKKSILFVLIGFFASLNAKTDIFILNFLKGSKDVAIFAAGNNFLEGFILIASSYTFSAIPFFKKFFIEDMSAFIYKMKRDSILLFLLGIMISVTVYFIGPILLPIILKTSFNDTIKVTQIICFALPFILLSTVFNNILYILKKTYVVMFSLLFHLIIDFCLNIIFVRYYSYMATAYICVIGEMLNSVISFIVVYAYLSRRRSLVPDTKNR